MIPSSEGLVATALRKIGQLVQSFWLVVLFLAVGWGPAIVADLIREWRPGVDESFAGQHFAMQWIRVTAACSLLAIVTAAAWVIRFIRRSPAE